MPTSAWTLRLTVLVLLVAPAVGRGQAPAPKLHALLVIDTDSNLRKHLVVDRDNLKRVLSEGFATRPHRLKLTVLEGADATPAKVLAHYQGLVGQVSEADTLLFYYTGHGAADADGQFLALQAGRLNRDRLRRTMAAVGKPRQVVLLTDCCSEDVRDTARGPVLPRPPKATWPVMDLLFFNHSGVTDINGCQENALSWCYTGADGRPAGGTFTLALVPLLCAKKAEFGADPFVTWEVFARRLQADTDAMYQRLKPRPDEQATQTPQVFDAARKDPQEVKDNYWLFGASHADPKQGPTHPTLLKVFPDTPADEAGLRPRDVIRSVNGVPVRSSAELHRELEHADGPEVVVRYERAGQPAEAKVVLKLVKPKP